MKIWQSDFEPHPRRVAPMLLTALALLPAVGGCGSSADRYHAQFVADLKVLKQICEKYDAGDKIYRTVENVQGVYQATVAAPYPDWGDQFGMKTPWLSGAARNYMSVGLGDPRGGFYWFVEAPGGRGDPTTPRFQREYLYDSGIPPKPNQFQSSFPPPLVSSGLLLYNKNKNVEKLLSEFQWSVEDFTTREMRAHWITGGRIKVTSRITGEILAEQIHFYRATGPMVRDAWTSGVGCENPNSGYDIKRYFSPNMATFIKSVLLPPKNAPTSDQLQRISGD